MAISVLGHTQLVRAHRQATKYQTIPARSTMVDVIGFLLENGSTTVLPLRIRCDNELELNKELDTTVTLNRPTASTIIVTKHRETRAYIE